MTVIIQQKARHIVATIIIKDDNDLLKVKKGDKVIDQRPNKEVDLEVSRHWYEYNEELVQAEKDNNA